MRIAIPVANGVLGMHFGHAETFALIDVDPVTKKITGKQEIVPPPHQPGLLPPWLAERGVNVIIAGGMGQRAQDLFAQQNISVTVGAAAAPPDELVSQYLSGELKTGANVCDH
jgi:predicted Fe-Mo cluster-binding NifX family protein